jgi:large subunit ribosomal protein LX
MIMENSRFEVKGTFMTGSEWHPYTKVIDAPNEAQARERTFAVIGSKHRLKRRYITISSVLSLPGE